MPLGAVRLTGGPLRHAQDLNARYLLELGFAAWAEGIVSRLSDSQVQRMLNTEFGGRNEIGCVCGVGMIRANHDRTE